MKVLEERNINRGMDDKYKQRLTPIVHRQGSLNEMKIDMFEFGHIPHKGAFAGQILESLKVRCN